MRGVWLKGVTIFLFAIFFLQCQKSNPVGSSSSPCGGIDPSIVYVAPYLYPIWYPKGLFIGFNYSHLDTIMYPYGQGCWGEQIFSDNFGFWLINPDGTHMHKIFKFMLKSPVWSPDGQWIAFNAIHQIFKMRFTGDGFDTTTIVQLTFKGRNFFPAWSPDGQRIAYSNNEVIYIKPANDSETRRQIGIGTYPYWSPNGQYIIYTNEEDINDTKRGIWITSLEDSSNIQLFWADPAKFQRFRVPKYSPDGTRIAFVAQPVKGYSDIWVMDANGANPQQITFTGVNDWLDWSPDGSEIIYTDYRFDDWTYNNGTLWMVNPDTGHRQQLTRNVKSDQ